MLNNAVVRPKGQTPAPAPARGPASEELLARIEARLQAARVKMLFRGNWKAFGYLAMHLEKMPVEGLGTCATDGDHFLYDPVVLDAEPSDWQEFNWAHEVMHLFGMDLSRAPKDDVVIVDGAGNPVKLWNLACDLWNNLKLEEEGFTIPSIVPIDRGYKGWSKDQIYHELLKKVKQGGGNGNGDIPKGRICGGFKGKPGKKGKPGQPGGDPKKGPLSPGDVEDWKPSKDEKEKWKARAKEAVEASKLRGTAPGFAEAGLRKLLNPILPWREILWPFCVRSSKEWRYRPPSRTGAARGMILPRLCPEDEIEHGVFIFDTSGSIGDSNLDEFCTEIESILNTVRMKATVLMVDAQVHEPVYHFEPGDFNHKALRFLGRGGTDFRPAFDWIDKHMVMAGTPPTFAVYFTDTYGSFPKDQPEYPVLWAVTHPDGKVPWGQYLTMRDEAV